MKPSEVAEPGFYLCKRENEDSVIVGFYTDIYEDGAFYFVGNERVHDVQDMTKRKSELFGPINMGGLERLLRHDETLR